MNRFILFLCCLLIPWTARGQATYDGWYWFDGESVMRPTGSFRGDRLSMMADAGALDQGLHAIHIQVVDTAGVYSPVLTTYFFHVKDHAVKALRYWFDNDTEHVYDLDYVGTSLRIDVSALEPGLHNLYLQLVDASGNLSDVVHQGFYRTMRRDVLMWTYWFDGDESTMTTVPYPGKGVMIDVSGLADGFHTMHNVVNDISQSAVETRMFVKVPQTEGVSYMDCICSVDGRLVSQEKLPAKGGVMQWSLDVASLDVGIHKAQFVAITPSGAASTMADRYFVRAVTDREMGTMKCFYSLDNFKTAYQAGTMSNGLFHFDLDVSEMEDGLHRLAYMLVSDNGITTPQQTAFFWKTPLGGSGITQYDYWLNQSTNIHSVTLDKRVNPFSLVELLPVESEPIRSECFYFEVKDGVPMMYALNDFHLAFYDATGRRVDESRQFIDYSVSLPINDLTPLDATQTFDRPAENEVKWFTFEAQYGDSIALRASQPVSLQVFDAEGKEVYTASADKSVIYDGCHLRTDGTCYVAVHDVTGTRPNVTLDVQRIDKFAVFDFTPTRMAMAGTTLMDFTGNGLNSVSAVELTKDDITIRAEKLVRTETAMTALFTCSNTLNLAQPFTLKVYFHDAGTDETKTLAFDNAVVLEPAVNIPQTKVQIISEPRVSDPYVIKVKITNEGNVSQFSVPFNVAFDNPQMFDEFVFADFDLLLSGSLYQSRDFCTYTDNLLNTGKKGFFLPVIIPYIGPYETRTLTFGVRTQIAHAKFRFYAWTGTPWYDALGDNQHRPDEQEYGDCPESNIPRLYDMLDGIDDLSDLVNLPLSPASVVRPFLGAGEAIAGFIQGSTRMREDATFKAYGIDPSEWDNYRFQYRHSVRSPRDIWNDAQDVVDFPIDRNATSGCPEPNFRDIDVYIPGDPNEMTGYSAPSGSRYMSDEVKTIGYDIEFENDPEIANSSAHRIVIENQLDPTKFDLKTFTPKDITLSGKKVELDGEKSFVKTIDLRPQINALAQLECDYSVQTGVARWTFTSLDPMTMEPTDDIMQGVLPVNYDGTSGIGNVTYTVDLLRTFPDGTEVANSASIIFDNNDPIVTPVWVNTVDAVKPTGRVATATVVADTTAVLTFEGDDARSGMWRYDVYMQRGSDGVWEKAGECLADSTFTLRLQDGTDYGFCALAIDSAGNVEVKDMVREAELVTYVSGDANGDGVIDIEDVVTAVSHYLGEETPILFRAADVNGDGVIDIEDVVGIREIYLGAATPQAARLRSTTKRQRLRTVMQQ